MFVSELDLQNRFISLMEKELTEKDYILEEFNARFGNVDVIRATFDSSIVLSQEQAVVLSNYQNAKVVAYLHKNAIRTKKYLLKSTDYDRKCLNSILAKLKNNGIIKEVKKDRYVIAENFKFPALQFVSYEAKLEKWKNAVSQALINKKFSSESFVVVPMNLAEGISKKHLDYFKSYNVGLIGVSLHSKKTFFHPKKSNVKYKINPSFISSFARLQLQLELFS